MTTFMEMIQEEKPTEDLMRRLAEGVQRGEDVSITPTEQLFVMMHLAQSFSAGGLAKSQSLVVAMIGIITEQFITQFLPDFRYYTGKVTKEAAP